MIEEIERGFHGKERIARMVQNISGFFQKSIPRNQWIPRNPRTSSSKLSSYEKSMVVSAAESVAAGSGF
ncbi:MAG: hypothetical protein WBM17_07525 [Anaerolineales bacterium]